MSKTSVAALLFAAVILMVSVPTAWAQAGGRIHQDHTITFDEPIALVNGMTLPAGTYLFSFPSVGGGPNRNVTRISSPDRSKVYATLPTISRLRTSSSGFDVVLVSEGSGKTPRTLKAWFCDGTKTGHEFAAQAPKE